MGRGELGRCSKELAVRWGLPTMGAGAGASLILAVSHSPSHLVSFSWLMGTPPGTGGSGDRILGSKSPQEGGEGKQDKDRLPFQDLNVAASAPLLRQSHCPGRPCSPREALPVTAVHLSSRKLTILHRKGSFGHLSSPLQ